MFFHQSPLDQSEVLPTLFLVDQSEVLPTLFLGKKAVEGVLVFDRRDWGLKGEKQWKETLACCLKKRRVSFCFLDCICMGGSVVLERWVALSTVWFPCVCNNGYYTMNFLSWAVRMYSGPLPCGRGDRTCSRWCFCWDVKGEVKESRGVPLCCLKGEGREEGSCFVVDGLRRR